MSENKAKYKFDHQDLDGYMLDKFEKLEELSEAMNMPTFVVMCEWVNRLYERYEDGQSTMEELKEQKEYYEERCREEGIY